MSFSPPQPLLQPQPESQKEALTTVAAKEATKKTTNKVVIVFLDIIYPSPHQFLHN
jgi:hypothetical protein